MEMEEGYRRGTVLGLTIAEIFILLVFLMLLALMGVNHYWGSKLEPWKDIMAKTTPEKVTSALGQPGKLRSMVEKLNEQIAELKKEKQRLQERIRTMEGREEEAAEQISEANRKLQETMRVLAEREEALTNEIRWLKDRNNDLQEKKDMLDNEIRIIGKGITPPCWYRQIEEANPLTQANWREKPYYLFDIAIRDDHMEVQRLPTPEGSAEDDGGEPYIEEAKELALDTIPYGTPLTDREVRSAMRHLLEKGKTSQIRTYSCIFYVRVWDETHAEAKERWKRAHDGVLEQLFGTHQVRGVSWKDRDNEPVNLRITSRRDAQ